MKRLLAMVLVLMMAAALLPASAEAPLEITMAVSENTLQPILQDTVNIKFIQEKFGIHINLQAIPSSDYQTKIASFFNTNDLPDIIVGASLGTFQGIEDVDEMLIDLYDYRECLPTYFGLIEADDRINATKTYETMEEDGSKSLYLMRDLEYNRIDIAPIGQIRTDLLEEQGIPMPTNWDELYDAMLKIKEKHPDVYFFGSRAGTTRLIGALAYPMGSGGFGTFDGDRGMYYEKDLDKWIYGPSQAAFKDVIQYLANAWKDGLIDPDYQTSTRDELWEKISTGKVVYFKDNNSFLARVFQPAFDQAGQGWKMEIVPPLANKHTSTRELRYERDWSDGLVISKKCPEIERVLKMLDWCFTEEGVKVMNFGIEGETYYIDEEGHPMVVDSILEQTKDAVDQFNAIQSILGVGCWCWTPYIDEGTYLQTSGKLFIDLGEEIRGYTEAGLIDFKPLVPSFTTEENEKIAEIELRLDTIFDSQIDAFITGTRSMDEWDSFVAELNNNGVAELEELFNTAFKR
ncbi:MAG: extracellular solute-binding protein [Clostridiales bacterium]|nr:extracellular solute-binding protein [Clostridiales bacterium]